MNKYNKRFRANPQRGFSLIEVMIAVVVLATGLLALTALQSALMRSSADAKARSMLVAYAQSEMDRLRLSGVASLASQPATSSASLAADHPLVLAANAAALGSVTQTVTVSQYRFDSSTNSFVLDATPPGANAHFKRVNLALTWTDATGGTRTLTLATDMSPLALSSSPVLVDREPPEDAGLRPIVRRPSPVTEGMIPIALGDGQDTAATNPKPVLIGRREDTLVSDTRFEVLTYNPGDNLGNSNFARFNKRIETAVVGCTCQSGNGGFPINGPDAATNSFLRAYRFEPAYWDGEKYANPTPVSNASSPTSPTDASQSVLCDVCCRDHKDPNPSTASALYKPWPKINETAHDHYRLDTNGAFVVAGGGEYLESCRVIRVNGMWRVTPDPRLDDLALVPTLTHVDSPPLPPANHPAATSPLISDQGKSAYGNYMFSFVHQRYYTGSARNTNFTDEERYALQGSAGLNSPEYVPLTSSADRRWLHARGVLVDYLVPKAVERITKAIDACPSSSTTGQSQAQCVLPYLPLATINVTELARWSGSTTSQTGIQLSDAYSTTPINYGQARMRRHSSGVALAPANSPDDDALRLLDEQTMAAINSVRTGVWLSISDANGVVFGDPTKPTRGAASIAGGFPFSVSWAGVAAATNNSKADDPLLVTVPNPADLTSEVQCRASTAKNSSNPYACTTDSASNVMLGLAQFNRKEQPAQNQNTNPCNSANNAPKVPRQASCIAHTLTSVVVDGVSRTPTEVGYSLVAGSAGKPSEKRTLVLPSVRQPPAAASGVTLNFSSTTSNAQAVCEGTTFIEWSCN